MRRLAVLALFALIAVSPRVVLELAAVIAHVDDDCAGDCEDGDCCPGSCQSCACCAAPAALSAEPVALPGARRALATSTAPRDDVYAAAYHSQPFRPPIA